MGTVHPSVRIEFGGPSGNTAGGDVKQSQAPTLEEVRHRPEAAWLWDGARGRIVWANQAGIAYFGCEILFDLIDRPFDLEESGVREIALLTKKLAPGESEAVDLSFPSSPHAEALACVASPHALADGRPGLLVIEARKQAEDQAGGALAQAFDLLPIAACFMRADGAFHQLNAAAKQLLTAEQCAGLHALVGSRERGDSFLTRLTQTSVVSEVLQITSRIGPRDIRLTLRRLAGEAEGALALIDDVTDRRALERQAAAQQGDQPPPAPRLLPQEAEAFQNLGRVLGQATPPHAEIPVRRKPMMLPDVVKTGLDRMPEPLLIAKGGALLYANPAALKVFGHATPEDLVNDKVVWQFFAERDQSLPPVEMTLESGKQVKLSASLAQVAWQNGPANQFTLRPAELPKPVQAQPQPAPESAAPQRQQSGDRIKQLAQRIKERAAGLSAETRPAAPPPQPQPAPQAAPQPLQPKAPQASDSELRAILDTASDGFITLDQFGKIINFSAGAEAIFGYRTAEVKDQFLSTLMVPESRKVVRDYLAALQGPGLASVFNDGREVQAIVKQGGTTPLFLTIGTLEGKSSIAAFCAVVRDITQWKRTETELREAKDAAESASRQKSEFLARISHEVRTPLNAIMGFSEVMRLERFGPLVNEKYKGYVNDIYASGGMLLSLINDLLDLSKVEAGQLELNFTSVNLSETADHAIRMLQEAATTGRVVIRKAMPADLPNVVADQRSMRQIMLNIISNAIKFTDPGGQVIVSANTIPSGELKFRVKDTGIGMSETELQEALQPFKRIATEGRETQGTGLGLPLTKALAEANRTTFSVDSEPRKGTMVEITFPTTRVLAE
jgi:PAS domain S-box-containing protein